MEPWTRMVLALVLVVFYIALAVWPEIDREQ